ncbi:MAG: MraY family glycosyltransferase [Syntrophobacteraceae bacterium]
MIYLSILLLSTFATIILIPLFMALSVQLHALDMPSDRKVHVTPIPRSGGIAMALGTLISVLVWIPLQRFEVAYLAGAGVLVLTGVVDDLKGIDYKTKFAGQIAAAIIVVVFGGVTIRGLGAILPDNFLLPDWLAIPLTVFTIIGITNAVNLADGLDGLAGGISLLAFGCIGYIASQDQGIIIALIAVALSGAIFGFLRFNSHPATLFMGDTGSQLLGFSAVTLGVMLTQGDNALNKILPFVLVGFPVLDTLSVMAVRVAKGKSPFMADKNHYHHKLMRFGFTHKEAVIIIYFLQVLLVTGAFLMRNHSEWLLLGFYVGFSGFALLFFTAAERTGWTWRRYDLLDVVIRTKFKVLQESNIGIRVSFEALETGLPGLLLLSCFVAGEVPAYCSASALVLAALILTTWFLRKQWIGGAVRVSLYLLIPYIVYFSEMSPAGWVSEPFAILYNLLFGVIVLFMILTLKFTRRRKGFKTTPMDYLILFAVIVIPNLPGIELQNYQVNVIITKIVVFFFGFEVLMGELRGEFRRIALVTVSSLLFMGLRGFM